MLLFWIIRLLLVLIFLIAFLRRSNLAWAAGLLAAAGVVLLDVLRVRNLLGDVGYLGYFLAGCVIAGAFLWLVGLFRPKTAHHTTFTPQTQTNKKSSNKKSTSVDRQMLYEQIRANLSPDDILDLIYDLGLNENDVVNPTLNMQQVIVNVMDEAEQQGKTPILASSVERILTPMPKENLPRLEKLSAETPPSLLRQYLIAHYSLDQMAHFTQQLGIDWDEMGSAAKKTRIRKLLLYLSRRNRLTELITQIQKPVKA